MGRMVLVFFVSFLIPANLIAQDPAPRPMAPTAVLSTVRLSATDIEAVRSLGDDLAQLGALHVETLEAATRLAEAHRELAAAVESLPVTPRDRSPLAVQVRELQELARQQELQTLELQTQLQDQSRQFTLLANVMKSKHDTVKNSIQNIR